MLPLTIPRADARPFDLVGLGENSVDLVAVTDLSAGLPDKRAVQQFARLPGGQVATALVAAARLGARTRYLGAFGGDELGQYSRASLDAEGVDTTAARMVDDAPNRLAIIVVDAASGNRHVLWHRDAALSTAWTGRTEDLVRAATCGRVLLVDGDDLAASTLAAQAARRVSTATIVDVDRVEPGVHELLGAIDVIVVAEAFPSAMTGHAAIGKALEALEREYRAALTVVTLGAEGSLARCAGREIRTAGFRVSAIDTTGAGDVFRGALAVALMRQAEGPIEHVLTFANAAAAISCTGLGARGGLPSSDAVDRLIASRSG